MPRLVKRKGEVILATESFDKNFVVKDKKTAEYILGNLDSADIKTVKPNSDYREKLERGRSILKQL